MFKQLLLFIQKGIAVLLLIILSPILLLIFLVKIIIDGPPVIFTQKRMGKNKRTIVIYKFRTMITNAEKIKKTKEIQNLNEADGPVFKIKNDPRFTKVGRFLAHSGIDEVLQLINIAYGEMSFVGPRPLPLDEAKKIPKKYKDRFSVLPGITSLWVIRGYHDLPFSEWMQLDMEYIKNKSFVYDLKIAFTTFYLLTKNFISVIKEEINEKGK